MIGVAVASGPAHIMISAQVRYARRFRPGQRGVLNDGLLTVARSTHRGVGYYMNRVIGSRSPVSRFLVYIIIISAQVRYARGLSLGAIEVFLRFRPGCNADGWALAVA